MGGGGIGGSGGVGGVGGVGGTGGGVVMPPAELDVDGLVFWHRADNQVTAPGNKVSAWADGSGNGHDAVAPNTAAEPELVPGAIKGHPALVFDGAVNRLLIADHPDLNPGQGSFLYIAVGSLLSRETNGYYVWTGKTNRTDGDNWRLFIHPANSLSLYWGINGSLYPESTARMQEGMNHIIAWGVDAASSEAIYVVDGALERAVIAPQGVGMNSSAVSIGADTEPHYFTHMRLAEQAYYQRGTLGFSDAELGAMFAYMRNRYGL